MCVNFSPLFLESFTGFRTYSASEWKEDFWLRWRSVFDLGDEIPLLDEQIYRDMVCFLILSSCLHDARVRLIHGKLEKCDV